MQILTKRDTFPSNVDGSTFPHTISFPQDMLVWGQQKMAAGRMGVRKRVCEQGNERRVCGRVWCV